MMIKWLAGNCKKHLLEEKWLLAVDLRIAQQWKDQLNFAGHASINLHSKTLRSLAVSLLGEVLASRKISFVSQTTARMIVYSLVSEMLERRELEYFKTVNAIDGLCDLLAKSIRELRLAEVEPNAMAEKDFESAAKARDVIRVYQAYCERLQVDHAADYAACIRRWIVDWRILSATGGSELDTVEDKGDSLSVRFGSMPIFRRTIWYEDIVQVDLGRTTTRWMGHSFKPARWMGLDYMGRKCVVKQLRNGILRVGTDDAEQLLAFLNVRLSRCGLTEKMKKR